MLELPTNEAHLWIAHPDAISDPGLLHRYASLLTQDELAKQQRFVFPEGRHECLVTRALVRTVLSAYAPVDARDWRFVANGYGCPAIAHPREYSSLRFNLSHTRGMIVCAVAGGRDVGVDVEAVDRRGQTVEIAEQYFSPSELAGLRAQPADAQRARFFELWTLKEAYIKARGMGLSIPLDQFSFRLRTGEPIGVELDPRLADDAASWQFAALRPTRRHLVALALRRRDDPELSVVVRDTVPLLDEVTGRA
jgi:4'-phosphopantetheinyl transferase